MARKLTVKQRKFADEYIISGNATDAARKAGYSEKTAGQMGAENLKKPYILNYIEERLKELEDKQIAKQEEVLKYLTSVMRGKETEETLRNIGDGYQEISDIKVSAKDRIKAAELIGKRYSLWSDRLDIEGSVPVVIIDDLEEDDLDD